MSLSAPTEGFKLADGRIVMPNGKVVDPNASTDDNDEEETFKLVEVPSSLEAQKLVTQTRRKLADLPAVPRTLNAISAVLSYTLFGLDEEEIALATNMTLEQVANIKKQEAYEKMRETVVETILQAESDDVRELLAQQSRNSVRVMTAALHGKKVGAMQFAASREFLDRAGHRPVDVVEHRHRMDGGLVIEVIKKDETQQLPVIDMERI